MSKKPDVEISEVGLRDGLQSLAEVLPTETKKAWITAEAAAGVREIEVCSFVPPKLLPQFADAEEVVAHARTIPSLSVVALVPNLKGAERAMAAGVHKVSFTLSVSLSHSLANVRKTPDEQLAEFSRIVELRNATSPKTWLSAGLSTVFGCTYEGEVSEAAVRRLAVALAEAGADDITLADTVGYANPAQIKRIVTAVKADVGAKLAAAHLHDTRGLGLANACAVLDCGVTGLDASLGGLGGCPYAPGASGNIVTEDLAFMLEAMGLNTGIDIERLLVVRRQIVEALPGVPFHGAIARAGLPIGEAKATVCAA